MNNNTPQTPQACSNCRFWQVSEDDLNAGSCRVAHPLLINMLVVMADPQSPIPERFKTMFPQTKPTTWCGEWKGAVEGVAAKAPAKVKAPAPKPVPPSIP